MFLLCTEAENTFSACESDFFFLLLYLTNFKIFLILCQKKIIHIKQKGFHLQKEDFFIRYSGDNGMSNETH